MKRAILAASVVFALATTVWAQENDSLAGPELGQPGSSMITAEAAWDWLPGDLVFRNNLNDFDEILRENESGDWASIGVIRQSSGGPMVVFVDEKEGVTETLLDNFIDGEAYAVYRVDGLDDVRSESYDLGPMALYALHRYGFAYDNELTFENGKFYNSELVFAAALNAGVLLSMPKPLREITAPDAPLGEALLTSRMGHYPCIEATDPEMCWSWMRDLAIVTPGSILSSDALEQVYP